MARHLRGGRRRLVSALGPVWERLYHWRGRRAWSVGYAEAKMRAVASAVHSAELARVFTAGEALPEGHGRGLDERLVEYPWALARLPADARRLLDAGSALNHAEVLAAPVLRDRELHIATLAPEARCYWGRGISYVYADLRDLPLRDEWYDAVVSLSTLEHVGLDNALYGAPATKLRGSFEAAAAEIRRVLRPGGTLLASVPFGRATNLSWMRQFDRPMVSQLVESFRPSRWRAEYFAYTPAGWKRSSPEAAAEAEYYDVRTAAAPAPDGAAAARAIACLELVR